MDIEKPLIQIDRDDKAVVIYFNKGPLGSTFNFTCNCGDVHYAELLRVHFNERLKSIIHDIRKEEYEKGYKHGRGKQAKKDWFSLWLRRGTV